MRRFLRATLVSHGYRIVETDSGETGTSRGDHVQPDIVLLDLGLPDVDGIDWIGATARVVESADYRAVRTRSGAGQDPGARRGGGRLPHQTFRRRRALGPDSRGTKPRGREDRASSEPVFTVGDCTSISRSGKSVSATGGGSLDADRIQAPLGPDSLRGQSHHPSSAPERGVGPTYADHTNYPARLHGAAQGTSSRGSGSAAIPADRAGWDTESAQP